MQQEQFVGDLEVGDAVVAHQIGHLRHHVLGIEPAVAVQRRIEPAAASPDLNGAWMQQNVHVNGQPRVV